MNSVCTNSGGTALGVGRPRVGMNLISSLPCTSAGAVSVVGREDIQVVNNGDVVKDVGGQVSLRTKMGIEMCPHGQMYGMDPHHLVPWMAVDQSHRSPCHNQCPNTSHLLTDLPFLWCGHA